jgi:RNA polymerase sigma-70 factor (ECF subfamily)
VIAEAVATLERAARLGRPGPYQLQAAIVACHTEAATWAATDWPQILALYDLLLALTPSPVVALNRAVAVRQVAGPGAALDEIEALAPTLDGYHLFHAIRADLLRRLGRDAEAALAYEAAIARTENAAERAFLERGRRSLPGT